jgi:NAD(P)-dependent dehydrogenase (short-subunit alcohol dehydrogenase family)
MPSVFITGASRGLGLEFARQFAADGWRVFATCRTPSAANELREVSGDVTVHALDVSDVEAVDRLAKCLDGEAIDLLINNAGIFGPREAPVTAENYQDWESIFRINTLAPYKVSTAFLPHILRGQYKRIVTVSSRLASITENTGGSIAYRSSKAAVNSVMKGWSHEVRPERITVVVLSPGWVKTDMGGPEARFTPEESVRSMRQVIAGLTLADSGRFIGLDGSDIPW